MICEFCGARGHGWQRHPEARAEVERRASESWDDHERHDEPILLDIERDI